MTIRWTIRGETDSGGAFAAVFEADTYDEAVATPAAKEAPAGASLLDEVERTWGVKSRLVGWIRTEHARPAEVTVPEARETNGTTSHEGR